MRRRRGAEDLDDVMSALSSMEERERSKGSATEGDLGKGNYIQRTEIGEVEHYYTKIGVAAIKLKDTLKVGEIIEIGSEDDAIRQRVESMQINRKDVGEASAGDSIGIKVKYPVAEGSLVYKVHNYAKA